MDWDSHRYLECYFAIPMMGAVLQTVNIRLSPEQILYTLNHAEAHVILCHTDFLPILDSIKDRMETVKIFVIVSAERDVAPGFSSSLAFAAEYEYLLSSPAAHQRLHCGDVYMPITPMFRVHAWGIPYVTTAMGLKQVYPGRYLPNALLALIQREKVTFSHCVPTILHMMLSSPAVNDVDLSGWKVIIGGSALPKGLAKLALEKGIDIFGGYGMSATCPVLSLAQLKLRA
jgi:fatty-acyl-CoA synthase